MVELDGGEVEAEGGGEGRAGEPLGEAINDLLIFTHPRTKKKYKTTTAILSYFSLIPNPFPSLDVCIPP